MKKFLDSIKGENNHQHQHNTNTDDTMKNCTVITYTVDAPEYGADCITEKNHWHTYPYSRPVITYRGAERILKNAGIDHARTVVRLQHMVRE